MNNNKDKQRREGGKSGSKLISRLWSYSIQTERSQIGQSLGDMIWGVGNTRMTSGL
jgi:hypothetical protein